MKMTREEAIQNREDCLKYLEGIGKKASPGCVEAMRWSVKALKAFRPVSRERVERMFPGCTYCKPDSEGYVQKFGAYSILNGELETGHCKPQRINFCPHCSRPLTDEAVEMVMERMEALKDG